MRRKKIRRSEASARNYARMSQGISRQIRRDGRCSNPEREQSSLRRARAPREHIPGQHNPPSQPFSRTTRANPPLPVREKRKHRPKGTHTSRSQTQGSDVRIIRPPSPPYHIRTRPSARTRPSPASVSSPSSPDAHPPPSRSRKLRAPDRATGVRISLCTSNHRPSARLRRSELGPRCECLTVRPRVGTPAAASHHHEHPPTRRSAQK